MKLSVVIVSYNVKFYLEQCLVSLLKSLRGIEAEVFVVDNHSSDGTVDELSSRFPNVHFICRQHNEGFARANNIAIKQCCGEYVLLLNPDTIVAEHTVKDVLTFMDEHPKAGASGVRMLKADGTDAMESRRGLPTPMTAFYKMCGLCARYPRSRRFARYYMSYLPWDKPVRIDVISGAFFMLRRQALHQIGALDEDFFMYGEDIDLSFRLLKAGYENWYVPSPILHYKGESTQKTSFRYVHVFYEAMLIFFKKHYAHMSFLLSVPIKAAIYGKAAAALVKMQMVRMQRSLGFMHRKQTFDPLYVFVGSEDAVDSCRDIAQRNGLSAVFHVADEQTLPQGIDLIDVPRKPAYVVYDVDAFSYDTILRAFMRQATPGIGIGTYSKSTRLLITAEDILK